MAQTDSSEDTMKRLSSHAGVLGVLVINADGIPVKSTFDDALSVQYAGLVSSFTTKARSAVKKLEPRSGHEASVQVPLTAKKSNRHSLSWLCSGTGLQMSCKQSASDQRNTSW